MAIKVPPSQRPQNQIQKSYFGVYSYCCQIARTLCFGALSSLQVGQLSFETHDGVYTFGTFDESKKLNATIAVLDPNFWMRIIIFNTLGLGEAYMYGEVEFDNIAKVLRILVLNRDYLSDGKTLLPFGLNYIANYLFTSRISNSIFNSLTNVQAHYDLGNEMFEAFLDETLMYSCPIWENASDTLAEAQLRKVRAILERAKIKPGQHILEIGTGWGTMAIVAAKEFGCKVTTITLSKEQLELAHGRIKAAGLSDMITVLLKDYRDLDPSQKYDHVVSCEMMEAIVITMPDNRYEAYCRKTDFIQKHIFPGGHCPSFTAITNACYNGTSGKLMVDEVQNIGPHYAKALLIWRHKFLATFESLAIKSKNPVYDRCFKRKWEFYFAYCEVGFATRTLGVMQMRFTRSNNIDLLDGIPLD